MGKEYLQVDSKKSEKSEKSKTVIRNNVLKQ